MIVSVLIIATYFVVTLVYFGILYYTNKWNDVNQLLTIMIITLIINFTVNYINASSYSKDNYCKVNSFKMAYNTFIAWFLILLPSFFFIIKFNWHRIFSNTFGLYFLSTSHLKDIINPEGEVTEKTGVLLNFYKNPYILIKELSFDNKEELVEKLNVLLPNEKITIDDVKFTILNQTLKKTKIIGYAIWFFFIAVITSLVSINMVLLEECMPSMDE